MNPHSRRLEAVSVFGERRCFGPLHGGESIARDRFQTYKSGRRSGRPRSPCGACRAEVERRRRLRAGGWIELDRVRSAFLELEGSGMGRREIAASVGVRLQTLYAILEGEARLVRVGVAQAAVRLALERRGLVA